MTAMERVQFRRRGGRVWHLARHVPSGYGVRALCGFSLSESSYTTERNVMRGVGECARCKLLDSRWAPKLAVEQREYGLADVRADNERKNAALRRVAGVAEGCIAPGEDG